MSLASMRCAPECGQEKDRAQEKSPLLSGERYVSTSCPSSPSSLSAKDENDELWPKKLRSLAREMKGSRGSKWDRHAAGLLASLFVCYLAVINSKQWAPPLFSPLEKEGKGWGKGETSIFNCVCKAGEVISLLLTAVVVPRLGGVTTMYIFFGLAFAAMASFLVAVGSPGLIAAVAVLLGCVKGLSWPAVGAMIQAGFASDQVEVAFGVVAFASRLGESSNGLYTGALLGSMSWRYALLFVLGISVGLAALWSILCFTLHFPAGTPANSQPLPRFRVDLGAVLVRMKLLFSQLDTWIVLLFNVLGWGVSLPLGNYAAVLMMERFQLEPSVADMYASAVPLGATVGLMLTTGMGVLFGQRSLRTCYVLMFFLGTIANVLLVKQRSDPVIFAALAGTHTALTIAPCYIATAAFALEQGQNSAFALAVLEAIALAASAGMDLVIGVVRQHHAGGGWEHILASGIVLTPLAASVLTLLYYRRRVSPVDLHSDSQDSQDSPLQEDEYTALQTERV